MGSGTARGMIGEHEPLLYALSVEPRLARPGDVVRLSFRTRNLGARPSASGTVRFALAPGLEPLAQTEVDVGPAAPGEALVATLGARIACGLDDRTELRADAVLALADASFATNAVIVTVRTRAHLDGAATGTFVESVDAETVRVRAVVTNDGDGPALGVLVRVGPPDGCVRIDGDGDAVLDDVRIDAGETVAVEMLARITEPIAEVRADDAEVRSADGARYALAARTALALAPAIGAPNVDLIAARRRAELLIDVPNDGWVDACDVPVRCVLPRALRVGLDEVVVDGAFAVAMRGPNPQAAVGSVRRVANGLEIVVGRIAARGCARILVPVACPAAADPIPVSVEVGGHVAEATVARQPVRELRVHVIDAPRHVAVDEPATIEAEVVNAGDVAENVDVALETPAGASVDVQSVVLRAGCSGRYRFTLPAMSGGDDAVIPCAIVARDAAGERARAPFTVSLRDRGWLVLDALPVRHDDSVTYRVRNAGSTTARDVVVIAGGEAFPCGALAPAEDGQIVIPASAAHRGGHVFVNGREALALPPPDARPPAVVHSALVVPPTVTAGAPLPVRLEIDVYDAVETLVVRAGESAGAAYVPGSTSLDGVGILDRPEGRTVHGEGLLLRGIGAGTRILVTWSTIAPTSPNRDALTVDAAIVVDGDLRPVAPACTMIREPDAFPARAPGAAYHVEARTVTSPEPAAPLFPAPLMAADDVADESDAPIATTEDDTFTFVLRLEGERFDDAARLLRAAPNDRLAAHALIVRALFPDAETSGDAQIAAALSAVREAVRDVFDRLYVKLRVPGFDVRTDDLEDGALRASLRELLARVADAPAGDDADDGISVQVERRRVRAALHACDASAYGAPAILRGLLALVPTRCDEEPLLGAALQRYAGAFDAVLARWESASREAFDDSLAYGHDETLDDARAAVLAAFRARTSLAGAAR